MSECKLDLNRLIECRNRIGITKIEAAKRIGVSQPAYLRYESGERTPSIQVIEEIANVFGTSSDYLKGKTDSPDVTKYVISEENDPELFSIIKKYYQPDPDQKKRFLAYMKKFQ